MEFRATDIRENWKGKCLTKCRA